MKIVSCSKQCRGCRSGLCQTDITNLGVTLNGKEILRDINLHIHCGELTAVIGANGAGKTTLMKAILGEIPHSGKIEFSNADHRNSLAAGRQPNNIPKQRFRQTNNTRQARTVIGYVPQRLDFDPSSPTTVLDLFTASLTRVPAWLGSSSKQQKRVRESLALVQAEHLLERRLGALSGGELQRVLLALALDPMPNLLLLDEPAAGIDQNGLELFYRLVSGLRRNYDLSIILVSHDLDMVAEYADRVALIHEQTIACCGTPQEVFQHRDAVKIFGSGLKKSLGKEAPSDDHILV